MKSVLFVCTHNSARSQMAEGLLRSLGAGQFSVFSAGTVATMVRPEAVAVMQELEIDISAHTSKTSEQFLAQAFDWVVTVCDNALETCPYFPNAQKRLHWSIPDPASVRGSLDERLAAFRTARDLLHHRITSEILTARELGGFFMG
jgi:arsenate reductase